MTYPELQVFLKDIKTLKNNTGTSEKGLSDALVAAQKAFPECDYNTILKIYTVSGKDYIDGVQGVIRAVFKLQMFYEACTASLQKAILEGNNEAN